MTIGSAIVLVAAAGALPLLVIGGAVPIRFCFGRTDAVTRFLFLWPPAFARCTMAAVCALTVGQWSSDTSIGSARAQRLALPNTSAAIAIHLDVNIHGCHTLLLLLTHGGSVTVAVTVTAA